MIGGWDVRGYWAQVREVEADLPETVVLVDRKTNVSIEVGRAEAARCLVDGSHRVASDDEAEKHRARVARRQQIQEAVERAFNRGIHVQCAKKG